MLPPNGDPALNRWLVTVNAKQLGIFALHRAISIATRRWFKTKRDGTDSKIGPM